MVSSISEVASNAVNAVNVTVSSYKVTTLAVAAGGSYSQTPTQSIPFLPAASALPAGAVTDPQNARADAQLICGMPFLPSINASVFTSYMSPFLLTLARMVRRLMMLILPV